MSKWEAGGSGGRVTQKSRCGSVEFEPGTLLDLSQVLQSCQQISSAAAASATDIKNALFSTILSFCVVCGLAASVSPGSSIETQDTGP